MSSARNTLRPPALPRLVTLLAGIWLLVSSLFWAGLALADGKAFPLAEGNRVAGWALLAVLALLPAGAVLLAGLGVRLLRNAKARKGKSEEAPATRLQEAAPPRDPPPALDVERALGAGHISELRGQVDLLCAMAAGERISPRLAEDLKRHGFAGMARQAAVSAEVVRSILADPRLADQLARSGMVMPPHTVSRLGADLHAITTSLAWLGGCIDPGAPVSAPLRLEVSHREQLTAAMDPVDQLLVQSTLLLAGISDLARVLAECYLRQLDPGRRHTSGAMSLGSCTSEGAEFYDSLDDFPMWKLN